MDTRLFNLIKRVTLVARTSAKRIITHVHWCSVWFFTLPPFRQARQRTLNIYNTYFDTKELPQLSGEISQMMHTDRYLWRRLSDRSLQGIRAWEYGKLVHYFAGEFTNLQVLDIGSGASTFPVFLASRGAIVTTFDYPSPLEAINSAQLHKMQKSKVTSTQGTMLHLPFCSESFDLVTCISTIEHLDVSPTTLKPVAYEQFTSLTVTSLMEMVRVVRPGGFLYLTTEVYEPELQKHDNWYTEIPYEGIGAAYRLADLERLFVNQLKDANCHFIGPVQLEPMRFLNDVSRSNFRGRYISTFCIFVKKTSFEANNPLITQKNY